MKIVILRSRKLENRKAGDYHQSFDTLYADRVIGNLCNRRDFCTACEADCIHCREKYDWCFPENIAAILDFPSVLPFVLEKPGKYVPADMPAHDVLLAIHIHEQILLEILAGCGQWGTKGVVVPLEAPHWVSGSAIRRALEICARNNIEISFPKPFCSFNPPKGSRLWDFKDYFHIGYPHIETAVENRKITRAFVHSSAPCGSTYFIARWLVGKSLEDDLKFGIISRKLHSYPCTASMNYDAEIGDSIMHLAVKIHFSLLDSFRDSLIEKSGHPVFFSPLGMMLPAPVSLQENVQNVEKAKKAILAELDRQATVPLKKLRTMETMTSAAMNAALLVLKREGKITTRLHRWTKSCGQAAGLIIARH